MNSLHLFQYYHHTGSNAKTQLETWYDDNIGINVNYSNKVVTGEYYCEEARAKADINVSYSQGTTMTGYNQYTPAFTCSEADGNGYGIVDSYIGLLNYDEVVYAGAYAMETNQEYYLYTGKAFWTMGPAGCGSGMGYLYIWNFKDDGKLVSSYTSKYLLRPVINLKADVKVTGLGTEDEPWVVQ